MGVILSMLMPQHKVMFNYFQFPKKKDKTTTYIVFVMTSLNRHCNCLLLIYSDLRLVVCNNIFNLNYR